MNCLTKKFAVYLPGTDDEQASAQNKREKKLNGYNARLEERPSALFPFPSSAVSEVTKGNISLSVHQKEFRLDRGTSGLAGTRWCEHLSAEVVEKELH